MQKAQIPVVKEPHNLVPASGLRPDGATLTPWVRGKPLAWDVTVPDTHASSHLQATATTAGAAADRAAQAKSTKYTDLTKTHVFYPISIETGGAWNNLAIELGQETGRRITAINDEPRETSFLFQRLSMALQKGNYLAYRNTFPESGTKSDTAV